MTRGSKATPSPSKSGAETALSPLKRLGAKKRLVTTLSKEKAQKRKRSVATRKASGLYVLDWTLGQFAPDSDEYRALLDALAPEDSGITYDRPYFLSMLGLSLSLSLQEKKQALEGLSKGLLQLQVDELITTFESERAEFEKLFVKEERHILSLYLRSLFDWSTILVGMGLSTNVMRKVVEDALCDAGKLIPSIFVRDAYFWMIVADFSIIWGQSEPILSQIIARGVDANKVEGMDRPFQLDLLDYTYRTNNLYSMTSPRAYIQRRVELLRVSALDTLPNLASKIWVSRVLLLGFADDYLRLGQMENAKVAVATAELTLKLIPESDRADDPEYKKAEALLAATELVLEACREDFDIGKMSSHLKKIFECQEPRLTTHQTLISLLFTQQCDLCCKLLEKSIEKEHDPNGIIDTAVDLLVFSKITADPEAYDIARSCLYKNLKSSLQELADDHSDDLRILRRRYFETMIFVWLVDGKESEEILSLWQAVAGNGFHLAMKSSRSNSKLKSDWPGLNINYLFIRTLEQRAIGSEPDTSAFISSIKEHWHIWYLLIVLYALSSNEDMRAHCRALARSLVLLSGHRMFGFPLGGKIQFFLPFTEGHHYAGSSDIQTQKWRGQLSYEALFT